MRGKKESFSIQVISQLNMSGFSLLIPGLGNSLGDDRRDCQLRGAFRNFPLQFDTRGLSHKELIILYDRWFLFSPSHFLPNLKDSYQRSVVEKNDMEAVSAVQRRFRPHFFPDVMVEEVGAKGIFQPPDRRAPDPENKTKKDIYSVIQLRGLDGQLAKYEGGLEMVEGGEIEIASSHP